MVIQDSNVKACKKCRLEKNLSSFYKKGDRFHSDCKSCVLEQRKTKYLKAKKCDDDAVKIVKIALWRGNLSAVKNEIVIELEAFLREVFVDEHRIN